MRLSLQHYIQFSRVWRPIQAPNSLGVLAYNIIKIKFLAISVLSHFQVVSQFLVNFFNFYGEDEMWLVGLSSF